jgi:putative transposase
VDKRKPVLATAETWSICLSTFEKLNQWTILAAVAMPDHLHIVITPSDREASVSQFAKWFKRWFNAELSDYRPSVPDGENMIWRWQEGCFDRLLRSDESVQDKWHYIRQNPVRAGLVSDADDWPYQFQFDGS